MTLQVYIDNSMSGVTDQHREMVWCSGYGL